MEEETINIFSWLLQKEQIFTLVTVVLSGVISWIISALYFYRGNRNALRSNILFPIKRILSEAPSAKNYQALVEITRAYEARYYNHREQAIIDELLLKYKDVCRYDYDSVCADSLYLYFLYKLRKSGIDPEPIPIYIEEIDEIVGTEPPPDLVYLTDDIKRILIQYPLDYDEYSCLEQLEHIFYQYCKQCYNTDKDINYFDDYSIDDILNKAKNRKEWDKRLEEYDVAKRNFLGLKSLK